MSQHSDNKKSVVIVGGGHAGTTIARRLSEKLDPSQHSLTLITARPFMVFQPALVRLTVTGSGDMADQTLMPYDHLFVNGNGKIITGTVTSVEDQKEGGSVELKSGERVFYDVLVLATGSSWDIVHPPDMKEDVSEWLKARSSSIRTAKSIVLVGGGAIGVEFSGEIKDMHPGKEVTIVHGDKLLLNKAYPDKFRRAVTASVLARGSKVILDDYIDVLPEKGQYEVTTRRGETLKADLVLRTSGPKPTTGFLSSLPSALTAKGHVRVKPTLQLENRPHIFAAGDIIDWNEQRQAAKVHGHSDVITANVLSLLGGGDAKKVYKGSTEMIIVTNGMNGGVAYFGILWGLVFGDWVSRLVKSKTLMISLGRAAMGFSD